MENKIDYRKFVLLIFIGILFLFTGIFNKILFNSLLELFTIVICFIIFYTAINSNIQNKKKYLMLIAIPFFFINFLNITNFIFYYVLSNEAGNNYFFQLKLIIKYILAITLIQSFIFVNKRINLYILFFIYLIVTLATILIIYYKIALNILKPKT